MRPQKSGKPAYAADTGSYTVSAESPDYADYMAGTTYADWEKPVYAGSVTKSVIKNNETTVDDLVCTLANIRTTVTLTQDLQKLFMSDADAEAAGKEKLAGHVVQSATTRWFSTARRPTPAKRLFQGGRNGEYAENPVIRPI